MTGHNLITTPAGGAVSVSMGCDADAAADPSQLNNQICQLAGASAPVASLPMCACGLSYLVLRVSCTDEQQLQGPQVTHPLTGGPDSGLQKGLAQLCEDPAVVQHPGDTRQAASEL